ncbi:MAG TPA: phage baseplate assembly protein V [Cytophagaceae bacterium]|jgi:uncharacterized protein involved in type VI secretion and phage assembly
MSSLHTNTVIYINSQKVTSFNHLQIEQSISGHHTFELVLSQQWFSKNGDGFFGQIKDLFGASIVIEITPEQSGKNARFTFEGIVTNVSTGMLGNGNSGFCTIKGFSPTILLDDDLHIHTYEDKDQGYILKDRLAKYPQNLLQYVIDPIVTSSFAYVVQYKENNWQFIRRLASTNGEWCFYNGSKLIFGKHSPEEIKLSHNRDLFSFEVDMGLRPSNQMMHCYDYEAHKPIETDTKSQRLGTLNQISDHLVKASDSLYLQQGLVKVNHHMNNSAQEHLKQLALMQRKSRVAQMVYARGESTNVSLKIGTVVNIVEDFQTTADHGKYFITGLSHVCTGDGNYSNYFTSIPSDAAAPAYYPDLHSVCESQSALVVENFDDKGLGRVKVRFHWQSHGMSPWIRVISASGGNEKGFYFVPEKGEEVLVDFEGGNPELPYVVGTAYNGKAKTSFGNKENDLKVIQTRSGHMIKFDDKDGSEKITISDKSGALIQFDTKKKSLLITAPETIEFSAKNIKMSAEENITIASKKKTQVASEKDVEIVAEGMLALQSQKDTTVKSKSGGITVEAMKDALLKGQNVTAEGKVKADIKGAQTTLAGKMTKVQGASGKIEVM